jgi:hypothetical protein
MKCIACGRMLKTPTKTVKGRRGPMYWGPVCALRLFGESAPRPRATRSAVLVEVDPRQLPLEGLAAHP